MKKVPHSGFFNPRALVAVVLFLAGASLAMLSFATTRKADIFGFADVDVITGADTWASISQDTSSVWGHGDTIVIVYADSSGAALNPRSFCGVSTSTDGGTSFTRLPEKFNGGGVCFAQSTVFYSVSAQKWYTSFLTGGCGGGGFGQYESADGINWANSGCAVSGSALADLPTSWVNNNPASAFYGWQYVAYNDFSVGGGAVRTTHSTDHGATWSAPVTVFATFRRAVKIFGSLGNDGTVYIQSRDEGGGGLNGPHQNFIHRSTDGGLTWSAAISQGAAFSGPGRVACSSNSYFTCMYTLDATTGSNYWSEMGWGQPAAGPSGIVHYAYVARTPGTDPGNIYYVRSTDGGITWSNPLLMNTDGITSRAQWGASVSANTSGHVFVSWYDERNTTNTSPYSYAPTLERFGRASTDNGATWSGDTAVSDVIFPIPLQPDSSMQASYAGLFDHAAFSNDNTGTTAYHTWTDGRRGSIYDSPQQDVFFDRIAFAPLNIISNGGSTIVSAGPNGMVDPGETVTVSLGVQNIGGPGVACTTAALTGTLQATGGVTNPTPTSQNYGALCSASPPVFRNFTFTVDPSHACGSLVIASLAVTDGATNYGTVTLGFPTGVIPPTPIEYFDGVSAPARPPGWTTTFSGSGAAVNTSTINPDTAPNALFATSAQPVGLSEVTSAAIAVPASLPRVTFRNLFNTEGCCDGEVLEISINGGAFADILAAGGSFFSGGYNVRLSSGFGNPLSDNPLHGRLAWGGLSGGTASAPTYITSAVNLPPAAAGQNIRLKWRVGSDGSVAPATNPGVRIDTVAFQVPFTCESGVRSAVSRKLHGVVPHDVVLPLGANVGVECRSGGPTNDHQVLITFANPVSVLGSAGVQAAVTSGTGTVGSGGVSNGGAVSVNGSVVNVPLTNVANAQRLKITLYQVNEGTNPPGDVSVTMGLLLGDTTGDGAVNASDVSQTKSQSGQLVNVNFRSDVTVSDSINASDVSLIKSKSGTALP